jgi:FkbM family methyltransferase
VPSRFRSTILNYGSRAKGALHAATAPRTKPRPPGSDELISLLFPAGAPAEVNDHVRAQLADGRPWSPTVVRQILGGVDQHHAPSPVTVRASTTDLRYVTVEAIEVAVDAMDGSVSQPLLHGEPYEPHVERVIRNELSTGGVFVDVGANIGYHTALASSLVGPGGIVYAFEPNPENARLLAHTIERNGLTNVRLRPFALSASMGYTSFRTAIGSNGGFVTPVDPREFDSTVTIVPTLRLDDCVDVDDRLSLIKIDVEGAEPMVISGAANVLERSRPSIIFEFSQEMTSRVSAAPPQDLFHRLDAMEYHVSLVDRTTGDLVPVLDPDKMVAEWDDWFRIEDFFARPREKA